MWLSFALLILAATLIVIFADELVNVIKQYWKNPWFKLFVPLLVASYLFLEFELFITWIFNQLKLLFFTLHEYLMALIPNTMWVIIAVESFFILLVTMLPVILIDRWFLYRHKTKRLNHPFYISLIIWLFLVMVYVSGKHFQ